MKRDPDLVRDLLLTIDDDPQYNGKQWFGIDGASDLHIKGHSNEEVIYHLTLLIEARLLQGRVSSDGQSVAISRLTWDGHEFVSHIRDAGIWHKTKERLRGLPTVAFSVLGEIAKAEVKKHLGLP